MYLTFKYLSACCIYIYITALKKTCMEEKNFHETMNLIFLSPKIIPSILLQYRPGYLSGMDRNSFICLNQYRNAAAYAFGEKVYVRKNRGNASAYIISDKQVFFFLSFFRYNWMFLLFSFCKPLHWICTLIINSSFLMFRVDCW